MNAISVIEPPPAVDDQITLVFDIETNGFKPSLVHCIAIYCMQTKEMILCADQPGYLPIAFGLELLQGADWLVGHNIIDYDLPVLERLYPDFKFDPAKALDTYLLAKSLFPNIAKSDRHAPEVPYELRGKHKLKAWGYRLGVLKEAYGETADWRRFSHEMVRYCAGDVRVTALLHEVLMLAAEEP